MSAKLSLFEKIYRELDSTFIGAEKKIIKAPRKDRYNYASEIRVEDDYIVIKASTSERLDFAQKVAEFYNAKYIRLDEPWRKCEDDRYIIKIDTSES